MVDTSNEAFARVADFYSEHADYPLRTLKAGEITVAGSVRRQNDMTLPPERRQVLWMAAFEDRAFISTRPDLEAAIREAVGALSAPEECIQTAARKVLREMCEVAAGLGQSFWEHLGVNMYCGSGMHTPIRDAHVRRISRETAADAICALRHVGIPAAVEELLEEEAAFAYYVEERPVAFAATRPVGRTMAGRVGEVRIGTLAECRGRGYGRAVASAATFALHRGGRVAVLSAEMENVAALRTATAVGFRVFCQTYALIYR